MPKIQFSVIRNVKEPKVAYDSAGVDFFMPEDLSKSNLEKCEHVDYEEDLFWNVYSILIQPMGRVCIPSGIRIMGMQRESALIAFNKSGISVNKGLVVGAQVVDYDYRGEIHISLINTSNKAQVIHAGDKIAQFIHVPIFRDFWERVPESLIEASHTDRGNKRFGSSNSKIDTIYGKE